MGDSPRIVRERVPAIPNSGQVHKPKRPDFVGESREGLNPSKTFTGAGMSRNGRVIRFSLRYVIP